MKWTKDKDSIFGCYAFFIVKYYLFNVNKLKNVCFYENMKFNCVQEYFEISLRYYFFYNLLVNFFLHT